MNEIELFVIQYDNEVFGVFGSREEAEASLAKQIANGGPAWAGCEIIEIGVTLPDGFRLAPPGSVVLTADQVERLRNIVDNLWCCLPVELQDRVGFDYQDAFALLSANREEDV